MDIEKVDGDSNREREELALRLDGYLEAAASINGRRHEFVMGAVLEELNGRSVETAITEHYTRDRENSSFQLISVTRGQKWTEVESFLSDIFLTEPFGSVEFGQLAQVAAKKYDLAWKAADIVMFLSPDQNPLGIHYVVLTLKNAVSVTGCVVQYEHDLLFITHIRWRRDARTSVPVKIPPKPAHL